MTQSFNIIGTSPRKVDAISKVTGQVLYAGDLSLPRMLHCKILRSPHAHARIVDIDTSEALKVSGVIAVLTGQDLSKQYGILGTSEDETPLAVEKVRYVGDPVVAIAAVDEETATSALRLVHIEYETLVPIMTVKKGLSPVVDEPIHSYGERENIQKQLAFEYGDTDTGFAKADLIQEDLFFYNGNNHVAIEEHATVAQCEADGRLTIWSSTQTPHYLHRTIAAYFELPTSQVRVIAPPTGGGFGGKAEPFNHELIATKFALMTGRPIKIVLTREEVFYLHRGRHPVLMRIKTGVKNNGAITAMSFESLLDCGAYGSYSLVTAAYTGSNQTVTYPIPHYAFKSTNVFMNKPPAGPKRGNGTPQPRFAQEVQMDKIAERLGITPLDLRLNHLVSPHSKTANHLTITTTGLKECLEAVAERSDFRQRYGHQPYGRGLGLAASAYICGASKPIYANKMPHSSIQILLDRGGSITVFSGSTDIGQGSKSILAMIVAEELGVSLDDIRMVTSDTGLTPVDLGSFASRVTVMTGNAALTAARELQQRLFKTAARLLRVPAERLIAKDGRIFCLDNEARTISFPDLAKLAEAEQGTLSVTGSYTPPQRGRQYKGGNIGPTPAYSYSACVVAVNVDPETAHLKIEKVWLAHDVGKALNPRLVEAQIEGSVYMGLGEALMEDQTFRKDIYKTPSILDYQIPTFLEIPDIETIIIETNDTEGPYGAKEVGQGPQLPVVPAVANAIYDAIGVRIDEAPLTPEKIFRAMRHKARGKTPRVGPHHWPEIEYPPALKIPSQWGESVANPNEAGGAHATPASL